MTGGTIGRSELFGLTHYYYGEAYFGSHSGMRFRLARDPLENVAYAPPEKRDDARLKASIWPEPYAYAKTPPEQITDAFFPFTEDGIQEAVAWMNEQFEKRNFPSGTEH